MMLERKMWFILMIILNTIVVILYFLWELRKKKENRHSALIKAIVMFICPVLGPLFMLLSFCFYTIFMSGKADLEDVIFSKARVETIAYPDEERERNMIPFEEALAITDKENLRALMLGMIKGDYRNMLGEIALALNSEDSETAHYAASVLQGVLNEFRLNVQEKRQKCMVEDEDQASACIDLIVYMNPVLSQKVCTDMEQKSMVDIMEESCECLYQLKREAVNSELYEIVSMRLLEVRAFEKCQKWCERALENYPRALESYSCFLKLAFSKEDRETFFKIMKQLRESEVVIDHETLEMIRTFI